MEKKEIKNPPQKRTLAMPNQKEFEETDALANKLGLTKENLKPILEKINKDLEKYTEGLLDGCSN